MALNLWSETRALYKEDSIEIVEATKHLEELERELSLCAPVITRHTSESSSAIGLLPPAV